MVTILATIAAVSAILLVFVPFLTVGAAIMRFLAAAIGLKKVKDKK